MQIYCNTDHGEYPIITSQIADTLRHLVSRDGVEVAEFWDMDGSDHINIRVEGLDSDDPNEWSIHAYGIEGAGAFTPSSAYEAGRIIHLLLLGQPASLALWAMAHEWANYNLPYDDSRREGNNTSIADGVVIERCPEGTVLSPLVSYEIGGCLIPEVQGRDEEWNVTNGLVYAEKLNQDLHEMSFKKWVSEMGLTYIPCDRTEAESACRDIVEGTPRISSISPETTPCGIDLNVTIELEEGDDLSLCYSMATNTILEHLRVYYPNARGVDTDFINEWADEDAEFFSISLTLF